MGGALPPCSAPVDQSYRGARVRQAIELGLKGPIIGPWYPTEFTVERVGELMFGRFVDYSCADFESAAIRCSSGGWRCP